jgi:hypothetical protein
VLIALLSGNCPILVEQPEFGDETATLKKPRSLKDSLDSSNSSLLRLSLEAKELMNEENLDPLRT